jgi:hypothetical protein
VIPVERGESLTIVDEQDAERRRATHATGTTPTGTDVPC